ncbi:MAG TPA: SGNH/GDSL hydrolase family protein [Planctomycetota bacterium]|nr:SGNH/GDSL hydrolase family protein [Planctomycetota bacterium]
MKQQLSKPEEILAVLVLAAAGMFNSSAGETQTIIPGKDQKINLLTLGDSHTENKVYTNEAFRILTAAGRATATHRCYGFGGRTAAQLLAMVKEKQLDLSTDPKSLNILCLMVGTNGYDVAQQKELCSTLVAAGWRVVVLTCPPRRGPDTNSGAGGPGSNGGYNEELRKLYPKLQPGKLETVQLVDIVPPLLDQALIGRGEWTDTKYNGDNVHLNEAGYKLIGKTVGEALLSLYDAAK